ncbi:MAG: glycosyltransferase family 4 protein [Bacteroidales bacterium]|nr:glycosyltransferase family 4 protein [Bacteroidales bacterium]
MKISYFFRKPSDSFHSIEEQFFALQKELPKDIEYKNIFAKYPSKGFFKRLFITIQSAFHQGDVNHITGDIHFAALFLKKKKTILTVHDIGSVLNKSGIKNKILRFFWFTMPFARVKYITVISEFTKNEILQHFKIKPEKIIVIPDCVSPEIKFSEKQFNSEKPNILQIGTKPNKNLPNLIKALDGITCKLTIIGKLSGEQIKLLSKHNVDYENKYNLNYSEIVKAYKNADIITFISTYEGFGVPILEAQATGRPLITSDLLPMKEVAGEGALLVNPYNVSEIKLALEKLISNANYRTEIIENGINNVKKYSAKSVAERYYLLYKKN